MSTDDLVCKAFTSRRESDPQGLIDDMMGQITRQAKEIHDLNQRVAELGGKFNQKQMHWR